jgi:hypothetical protein
MITFAGVKFENQEQLDNFKVWHMRKQQQAVLDQKHCRKQALEQEAANGYDGQPSAMRLLEYAIEYGDWVTRSSVLSKRDELRGLDWAEKEE